jgi:hypothetical protein
VRGGASLGRERGRPLRVCAERYDQSAPNTGRRQTQDAQLISRLTTKGSAAICGTKCAVHGPRLVVTVGELCRANHLAMQRAWLLAIAGAVAARWMPANGASVCVSYKDGAFGGGDFPEFL